MQYPGILVSWYSGIPVSCYPSTLVSWYPAIRVCWYPGMLVSWYPAILVPWYPGILECWYPGILVSWYPGILVSWYPGYPSILESWYSAVSCMKLVQDNGNAVFSDKIFLSIYLYPSNLSISGSPKLRPFWVLGIYAKRQSPINRYGRQTQDVAVYATVPQQFYLFIELFISEQQWLFLVIKWYIFRWLFSRIFAKMMFNNCGVATCKSTDSGILYLFRNKINF